MRGERCWKFEEREEGVRWFPIRVRVNRLRKGDKWAVPRSTGAVCSLTYNHTGSVLRFEHRVGGELYLLRDGVSLGERKTRN